MFNICFEKIGSSHIYAGVNCQDGASYRLEEEGAVKIVTDGCGSTPHPEVGVWLFHNFVHPVELGYFKNDMNNIFDRILRMYYRDATNLDSATKDLLHKSIDQFILKNLLFTILCVIENKDWINLFYLGDGFVIKQDFNDKITYEALDEGEEYPKYLGYNFINNKELLLTHKEPLEWSVKSYSTLEYKKIGVATDGLRYLLNLPEHDIERQRFEENLVLGKPGKIKQIINRHPEIFKDDISISF